MRKKARAIFSLLGRRAFNFGPDPNFETSAPSHRFRLDAIDFPLLAGACSAGDFRSYATFCNWRFQGTRAWSVSGAHPAKQNKNCLCSDLLRDFVLGPHMVKGTDIDSKYDCS